MCGIWGICYTEESKDNEDWTPTELAQLLFPAIRHRGPHAFGWMSWDGGDHIRYEKHEGDVLVGANLARVDIDPNAKWVVGHVRFATHGSTADLRNNHPIPHGDIIGVHNGVLQNHEEILAETGRQDDGTEVDSEAIFAAVNRWGHRAGLRKIEGNLVAVYARGSKPSQLYFARSVNRPLVFARTPAGSLVFASELSVLEAVWEKLTDVREMKRFQLIRVAGGRVQETTRYQTPPPAPKHKPIRPVSKRNPSAWKRTPMPDEEYFSRLRDEVRGGPAPVSGRKKATAQTERRLSKKQRKRARRAKAAREAREQSQQTLFVVDPDGNVEKKTREHDARGRQIVSEPMVWYNDCLMTQRERDRMLEEI